MSAKILSYYADVFKRKKAICPGIGHYKKTETLFSVDAYVSTLPAFEALLPFAYPIYDKWYDGALKILTHYGSYSCRFTQTIWSAGLGLTSVAAIEFSSQQVSLRESSQGPDPDRREGASQIHPRRRPRLLHRAAVRARRRALSLQGS